MKHIPLEQAQREVKILMRHFATGCNHKRKLQLLRSYDQFIKEIWEHWHVGLYGLKVRHVKWYFEVSQAKKSPGTRYRHWCRVRDLISARGVFNDWEPHLRGPWRNPEGTPFSYSNRGRKPKYMKLAP